jgi:galactarate dehydratase
VHATLIYRVAPHVTLAPQLIRLHDSDNVAVARSAVPAGAPLDSSAAPLKAALEIASGHKVALVAIARGAEVLKYGHAIGVATQDIAPGDHVHLHNVAMLEPTDGRAIPSEGRLTPLLQPQQRRTFHGYLRSDGQIGTRNYIGILTSVNCSATVSHAIAKYFNEGGGLTGFDNVDGVVALSHGGGCAINMQTDGYKYLTRTIAGYAKNPNFGGVLIIGLGCETNQISFIARDFALTEGPFLRTMTIQGLGGTRKTIDAASEIIRGMLPAINATKRTTLPLSGIKLALECGGSDGYSGISANPALGYASDLLVQHGGTAVLSETPEIYGAEHLLMRRAVSPDVSAKLSERIEWWRNYTERNDAELNNNPSHGNKAGGLTTIIEKSLGAVAKSGSMPLEAVYEYAEHIDKTGLVFMDTPGYDPVAVTGQIAGGCNIVVFTTGRGSVSGFKPAPCIKVASNNALYVHMQEDMDVNCGGIVTGEETIEHAGRRLFEKIVAVASGERTSSETYDYGNNEFVPWQIGAVT